jgi:ABC-2 type transport system permease protein
VAIHRRAYRPLATALTPAWSRFLVLPRYAWQSLASSKLVTSYLVICLLPALVAAALIYLYHNPLAQVLVGLEGGSQRWPFHIDGRFFYRLMQVQGSMALLLVAWIGPGLVAPDLVNNALPLYLSRPFSRAEYVAGRAATLFLVISAITWVPDVLLFALQGALASGWWTHNLRLLGGIVLGAWLWIAVMTLVALALSAWVKWRIVATGLYAGLFFVSAGLATSVNEGFRTSWGGLFNIYYLVTTIWRGLLDVPAEQERSRTHFGDPRLLDVPVGYCWLVLLALAACCLFLLDRRLRGREVVRG